MGDLLKENARFSGEMEDSWKENACFLLKRQICEEKMRVFAKMGDLRRENACYSLKLTILKEKTRDFHLNGGFAKGKRVIFA